jgi:hypothetical protein
MSSLDHTQRHDTVEPRDLNNAARLTPPAEAPSDAPRAGAPSGPGFAFARGGHANPRPASGAEANVARDRLAAERELRDRFIIVPDGFVGPRLPNQVTEAEFHNVAREYSDVRSGRGDLTIDTSERTPAQARQYRAGAMHDIGLLLQTPTGRAEIAQLSNNTVTDTSGQTVHRHTLLRALHQNANGDDYRDNDGNAPIDRSNDLADWLKPADAFQRSDGHGHMVDGPGTDVNVRYNPGVSLPGSTTRSDVLLAHELRHAIDETHGHMDPGLVDASDGVPADIGRQRYEHQATGIGRFAHESINEAHYRADRAAIGANEHGAAVEPGDQNMPPRPTYNTLP